MTTYHKKMEAVPAPNMYTANIWIMLNTILVYVFV
jgi:hypothetical protein